MCAGTKYEKRPSVTLMLSAPVAHAPDQSACQSGGPSYPTLSSSYLAWGSCWGTTTPKLRETSGQSLRTRVDVPVSMHTSMPTDAIHRTLSPARVWHCGGWEEEGGVWVWVRD